ncbi:major tail protein [Streptomyces phage Bogota]|nr:major tail protein [Streptomyces phage UNTPL]WIC89172.1 major tail protein [Streptomyces phage Bogota]
MSTPTGVNPNNVVVGLAAVWIQPWVSGTPAALPDDDVLYGAAWSSPWAHLGGTDQGWKLKIATKTADITIEEQSTPVDILADGKTLTVSGALAEDTLQHMLWAYGGGTLTTVAAGASQVGKQTLSLQDKLEKWALGVETINKFGFYRRFLIPKVVIASDVEASYRRAADKRMYSFEANSICPIEDVEIVDMTAVATGP